MKSALHFFIVLFIFMATGQMKLGPLVDVVKFYIKNARMDKQRGPIAAWLGAKSWKLFRV